MTPITVSCAEAVDEYENTFEEMPPEFAIMVLRCRSSLEIQDLADWEAGVAEGWRWAKERNTSNSDSMRHKKSFEFLTAFHIAAMLYLRYKPDWPHW